MPGQAATTHHTSRRLPPAAIQRVPPAVRIVAIVLVLYVFLASIGLMGAGFKSMGKGFAQELINRARNPFVGLFVGILTTSIVQSSSLTTSIVVAMVSAMSIDGDPSKSVQRAIPIIMGANIGTTVTCTLVSLGFIGRRRDFRRAFACGTMHDIFNLLCVLLFFPLEMITQQLSDTGEGVLQRLAEAMGGLFVGADATTFASPVKVATAPVVKALEALVRAVLGKGAAASWAQVALAFAILFVCLWAVTKLMRSLMLGKVEAALDRTVGRNAAIGLVVGLIVTAIIQSSSITTSILVPLAASGIITLPQAFPITVGANIGTTVTALLASLGGSPAGLHIALVHLLFNSAGALLFVPVPALRRLPIGLAKSLAKLTMRSRWYAIIYVAVLFFIIPAILIFLT